MTTATTVTATTAHAVEDTTGRVRATGKGTAPGMVMALVRAPIIVQVAATDMVVAPATATDMGTAAAMVKVTASAGPGVRRTAEALGRRRGAGDRCGGR